MKKILSILILLILAFWLSKSQPKTLAYDSSPYGMGFHMQSLLNLSSEEQDRLLNLTYNSGVRWVRVFIRWDNVQPSKDTWNWADYDKLIQKFHNRGFNQTIVLSGIPPWANKMGCNPETNFCPEIKDWRQFVRRAVVRYKGKVKHWELLNEPNLKGGRQGTVDEYFNLLKNGYLVVKETDPEAKVLIGSIASSHIKRYEPDPFADKLFAIQGIGNYFDILNFHNYASITGKTYTPGGGRRPYREVLIVFKQYASKFLGKQIWLTETGSTSDFEITVSPSPATDCPENRQSGKLCRCKCYQNERSCPADGYTDPKGEDIQAMDLKERYNIALELGFDKVFWYHFKSAGARCRWAAFTIIREDFTPKPAYCALKEIATGIPCISLSSGWNKITWPDISAYTAKTALEDMDNVCGENTAVVIAGKRKDWWKDYVKNFGGKNFTLRNNQNYFVKVSRGCTWYP